MHTRNFRRRCNPLPAGAVKQVKCLGTIRCFAGTHYSPPADAPALRSAPSQHCVLALFVPRSRRAAARAPQALTKRGSHELPQCIRFHPEYVQYLKEHNMEGGSVVSAQVAEWACGLPGLKSHGCPLRG